MSSIQHFYVSRWLAHVQALAETIGPRGSTRQGERLGSEYCHQVLGNLGLKPAMESFQSARSIYQPHLVAAIAMLVAFAVYPLAGRVTAIIAFALSLATMVSILLELSIRDNVLRQLVPKGSSQNVFATVAPTSKHIQDVVLIGHVDSHRTSLIFRSAGWVRAYKLFSNTVTFLYVALIVLYGLGLAFQWPWIWSASTPSAVAAGLVMLVCLQAESTPFSAGANDNATGAGLVLTLAEQLIAEPLDNTRVWLVCTGCEEVQHYGAANFFFRHTSELLEPAAVVLESLGCAGPAWLTKEGIIVPFRASPHLVAMAENVSRDHPEYGAYPVQISGGNTEMADALLAGVPAITIGGASPQGEIPYWHQVEDTLDKMNRAVMARAYEFTWRLLCTIDAGDSGKPPVEASNT